MPHLWRIKQEDDISPDATDVDKNGYDLRYSNIFESIDNYIYYNDEEIPEFIIHDHPNPKLKSEVQQHMPALPHNNTPAPTTIATDNNETTDLLDIIKNEYCGTESDSWKRLVLAIKSCFDYEVAKKIATHYSKKTTKNNYDKEAVLKLLEASPHSVKIGTIRYYSKLSNKDKFYEVKAKYHMDFETTDYTIANDR